MGLFFKRENCSICGKEGKKKIADGAICKECLQQCSIKFQVHINSKTTKEEILKEIDSNKLNNNLLNSFTCSKKIGNYIEFDEHNKLWIVKDNSIVGKVNPQVYKYEDIIDYELLEDGESITKGGLGRAVVGGALLGGVGAIVGGVTGKKKTKAMINSLKIKITVNDTNEPCKYINLVSTQTKASSFIYKTAYSSAQEILSMFAVITQSKPQQEGSSNISTADELLKLKQLLDEGILSKEEFDVEKNKILNR